MKTVITKKEGGLLKVTLNRPEVHNAFNIEMIQELTEVFRKSSEDPSLQTVLLSGAGKSFCAGGDLNWMKSMAKFTHDENLKDADQLFEMFWAARSCPITIIGNLTGNVMGGGLGLAAICDIVAAHKDTKFCFSEAKLGLVPSVISGFVLEKAIPHVARELMLTAEVFDVETCFKLGLLHFTGETEEVDDFVQSKIDFLANNGPEALRATKKLTQFVSDNDWKEIRKECTKVIADRRVSAEGQEGLSAFLERRKPKWRGVGSSQK